MAGWNIRCGLEVFRLLGQRWPEHLKSLSDRLCLGEAELRSWRTVAERLVVPFDPATGMIEQFAGYFRLEAATLAPYAGRMAPIDAVMGRDRLIRSQLIKQADVVALFALRPDLLDRDIQSRIFEYYEPRCAHESSLSRPMHALVAARLGKIELALEYFRTTAATDRADTAGGSAAGIHIAALGGLWQAAVLGFGGLSWWGGALSLQPRLPPGWRRMSYRIHWRGHRIQLVVEHGAVTALLETGPATAATICGRSVTLSAEQEIRVVTQQETAPQETAPQPVGSGTVAAAGIAAGAFALDLQGSRDCPR